jgi:hypothetical protein
MTPRSWSKLALSLPEVVQKSHFGQPDFRVHGKIFAGLSSDQTQGNLKLRPEVQAELLARSSAFTPAAGAWGRSGWTHVTLAATTVREMRPLMLQAWELVAPKALRGS